MHNAQKYLILCICTAQKKSYFFDDEKNNSEHNYNTKYIVCLLDFSQICFEYLLCRTLCLLCVFVCEFLSSPKIYILFSRNKTVFLRLHKRYTTSICVPFFFLNMPFCFVILLRHIHVLYVICMCSVCVLFVHSCAFFGNKFLHGSYFAFLGGQEHKAFEFC